MMKRSLCQLSTAILLVACLLLRLGQCQPVAEHSSRQLSPSSSLDNYLTLRALLSPDKTLPEYLYDDNYNDMERSRRSGFLLESFKPVSMDVIRRVLQSKHQEALANARKNLIDRNNEIMTMQGRR